MFSAFHTFLIYFYFLSELNTKPKKIKSHMHAGGTKNLQLLVHLIIWSIILLMKFYGNSVSTHSISTLVFFYFALFLFQSKWNVIKNNHIQQLNKPIHTDEKIILRKMNCWHHHMMKSIGNESAMSKVHVIWNSNIWKLKSVYNL